MDGANVALETLQGWCEEGKDEVVVEYLAAKPAALTPRESFYLVLALIHLDKDAAARQHLRGVLPLTGGADKADLLALSAFLAMRRGDEDAYLRLAREAVTLHPTPFALYHFGLALPNSNEAIPVLQAALLTAEEAADVYTEACIAHALALSYLHVGRYKEALNWSRFVYTRTAHPGLRIVSLNNLAFSRILAGSTAGLEALITTTLAEARKTTYGPQRKQLTTTLADLYHAEGRYDEALALYERELEGASRSMWPMLAHGCVRALRALKRYEDARAAAETAVFVSRTLSSYYRDYASLVLGVALWPAQEGVTLVAEVYPKLTDHVLATEAALHLAAAEQLGRGGISGSLVATVREMAEPLTETGLRFLAGDALVHLGPMLEDESRVRVHFLGTLEVYRQGHVFKVRQRSAELLLLLLQTTGGYTAEALSEALYGSLHLSALRVELHRLRKNLGLTVQTQPYRLTTPVWADVLELSRALNEGRIQDAVALYRGPLLPTSTAPGIVELRRELEAELHGAVLATGDPEVLWALAQAMPYDLELWEALEEQLPRDDPRRSVAAGRGARVRRELDL